jgi:hypothetical protein
MTAPARRVLGVLPGVSLGLVPPLTSAAGAAGPLPRLTGPPFAAPTHLHLIVAGAPPAIVDVDTGAVRVVAGVTTSPYSQVRLVPMAGGALAIVHQACSTCPVQQITYATRATGFRIGLDGSVERLGAGLSFLPARASDAVWVLSRSAPGRCTLTLARTSRPSRAAPCGLLLEDGEDGLRMSTPSGEVFVNPQTGRVRPASGGGRVPARDDVAFRYTGAEALEQQQLSLDHLASGQSRRVRWPSILRGYGGWSRQPHGDLIALEFADPAYPGPAQAEDFWLYDLRTGRFSHLPGFPAQVDLKFSSWGWIDDGRLVLLLQGGGRSVAAVWRPGSRTIPLVPIELPAGSGALGAFVAIAD